MAWTTPGTAVAGSVLTSAFWNANVRDNSIMGSPVYTNEAARDAAITAPSEGMQCYLTAPTIPAATGATTAVPTGIQTIYNGSVWVCTTPVNAYEGNIGTTTSGTYTATLSGSPGTNPTVTLVTGTTALVSIASYVETSTVGSGATARVSVAVSGAGVVAASDAWAVFLGNSSGFGQVGATSVITGLTAGTNTFTMQYLRGVSGTGTFYGRRLTVNGIA